MTLLKMPHFRQSSLMLLQHFRRTLMRTPLSLLLVQLLTRRSKLTLMQMKLQVTLPMLICLQLLQTTPLLTLLNQLLVQLRMLLLPLTMQFKILLALK